MKTPLAKKLLLSVCCCVALQSLCAQVIENPRHGAKSTSTSQIMRIERTPETTRVTVKETLYPYWWIKFSSEAYLEVDETDQRFPVVDIEGTQLDKQTYLQASGDSTFVLIFPPLPKKVKTINFVNGKEGIYGVSLTKKQKKNATVETTIPKKIQKWIDNELAKAPVKEPMSFPTDNFFLAEPARLIGYINGYDERFGFTNGLINYQSPIENDHTPLLIEIHPDGRFEAELPVNHPMSLSFKMNSRRATFYIEPGQTLAMIYDWNDFIRITADNNARYYLPQPSFQGPLAEVNTELLRMEKPYWPEQDFLYEKAKDMNLDDFTQRMQERLAEYETLLRQAMEKAAPLSEKAVYLLEKEKETDYIQQFLSYEMYKRYYSETDKEVDERFYDMLKDFPLNDPGLFISDEAYYLMNRFEFLSVFQVNDDLQMGTPEKTLLEYLQEQGADLTAEEGELADWSGRMMTQGSLSDEELTLLKEKDEELTALREKYSEQMGEYYSQYVVPIMPSFEDREVREWEMKDSIVTNRLGMSPNLMYDIAKSHVANHLDNDDALARIAATVSTPFVREEMMRQAEQKRQESARGPYALPAGKAADTFHRLIAPFSGKYLFINLMPIYYAENVIRQKEVLDKYRDHPNMAILFIIEQSDNSYSDRYEELMKELDWPNDFRVSINDFNYFSALFGHSGMTSVVVNPEGLITNDKASFWNLEYELRQMAEALNPEQSEAE